MAKKKIPLSSRSFLLLNERKEEGVGGDEEEEAEIYHDNHSFRR